MKVTITGIDGGVKAVLLAVTVKAVLMAATAAVAVKAVLVATTAARAVLTAASATQKSLLRY